MKYRAFVSSTFNDLKEKRAYVVERLRKAGVTPVAMEDWPADAEHPAQLSTKRTAGCHFLIALVAFQRGTFAANDPLKRSFTQLEIEAARKHKSKILVFMLADTPQNRQQWPSAFNHLSDEAVVRWRSSLETELTCEFFNANDMPDVLPAITHQITAWEQRARKRLHILFPIFLCLLLAPALAVLISASFRWWVMSKLLMYNDPVVFQHSRDGRYQVSRLLEGRSDIQDNTNFREEISLSRKSFSLFANTFGSFRDYANEFEQIASRGVKLRFIITDFSDSNRANWEEFIRFTENMKNSNEATRADAQNILEMIHNLAKKYPEQVELRLNRKPLYYTLWIRDPESDTALAHLGIHYYGRKSDWPAYRVSRNTGGKQIGILAEQFETLWKDAFVAHEQ